MTRYFTHYWANDTWERDRGRPKALLQHTAGGLFRQRGVQAGDIVYVITVLEGHLLLGGRMRVAEITNLSTARRRRGDVWDAPDHAFGTEGTILRHDRAVPPGVVRELRFAPAGRRLKVRKGKLDQQTLRGVRELTVESAHLLDAHLEGFSNSHFHLPEELPETDQYSEGRARRIVVNAYERDERARRRCIGHHGHHCSVCDLDMQTVYGERGRGFIHVHHLKPLSKARGQRRVHPVTDLRPVCPNCHAMLHRTSPPCGIAHLRRIVQQLRRPTGVER